jgi:hypothetical protein
MGREGQRGLEVCTGAAIVGGAVDERRRHVSAVASFWKLPGAAGMGEEPCAARRGAEKVGFLSCDWVVNQTDPGLSFLTCRPWTWCRKTRSKMAPADGSPA